MSHYPFIFEIVCGLILLPHLLNSLQLAKHGKGSDHNKYPLFVAHRGDKAILPEHTIPGYDRAMQFGVDFVEPDLVLTKDGILVCCHDIYLKRTTNVASLPEFAHLMRENVSVVLEGRHMTILNDWFIIDFTLEQLKKLRVNQPDNGIRPQYFNGLYGIPTFQEYIEEVHRYTWRRMKLKPYETFVMGMIPELKHPHFHTAETGIEYHLAKSFIAEMKKNGYLDEPPSCKYQGEAIPCSPLVVQCFNVPTIKYLSATTNLKLLTVLEEYNYKYLTYQGMAELENKTDYLAIWKEHLFTETALVASHYNVTYDPKEVEELGGFIEPEKIVEYANWLGMKVGIYTIYPLNEKSLWGCAKQCVNHTKEEELNHYFEMGVEMFFIEGICDNFKVRDKYFSRRNNGGSLDPVTCDHLEDTNR